MKKHNEIARDNVVNQLVENFPDLLAFVDKPYSFALPITLKDGTISYVRIGVTSCAQRFDKESETMSAKEYVDMERKAREFVRTLSPN